VFVGDLRQIRFKPTRGSAESVGVASMVDDEVASNPRGVRLKAKGAPPPDSIAVCFKPTRGSAESLSVKPLHNLHILLQTHEGFG